MCPHFVYTISEDVIAVEFSYKRVLSLHSVCSSQVCTSTRLLGSLVSSSGMDCNDGCMTSPTADY